MATTSTSTRAPFGSAATATQERAGSTSPKLLAYSALKASKSPMSARKQVVFTTWSQLLPASFRMASMFAITRAVWAWIPPSTSLPVAAVRMAIWPEVYRRPKARFACT